MICTHIISPSCSLTSSSYSIIIRSGLNKELHAVNGSRLRASNIGLMRFFRVIVWVSVIVGFIVLLRIGNQFITKHLGSILISSIAVVVGCALRTDA